MKAENINKQRGYIEPVRKPIIPIVKPGIIERFLPDKEYFLQIFQKTQLGIHHTVSGEGVEGDFNHWETDPSHIATAYMIARDGKIFQAFDEAFWAHHLGIKSDFLRKLGYSDYTVRNKNLNKASIGIELDSWGGLIYEKGKWRVPKYIKYKGFFVNEKVSPIDNEKVIFYPKGFRGFKGFEKYTTEQINSLELLLVYLSDKFKIPVDYKDDMWDISRDALGGEPGIYSHVSYRTDKSDCHPQKELIDMLKALHDKYWQLNSNNGKRK